MNGVYNLCKFVVGIGIINYFMAMAVSKMSGISALIGVALIFLLISSVSFCKGQENTWAFLICLLVTVPLNVKFVKSAVDLIFEYNNIFARGIISCAIYLYILMPEELFIGIVTRVIWRRQKESFCRAGREEELLEEQN